MARHAGGWVKIHRKVLDSDIGKNFLLLGLWTTLIRWANWTESQINWRGVPRTLGRGEMLTSAQELAEYGEVDRKTVTRWLNYLALRGSLVIEKAPKGSHSGLIIRVINYEKYQGVDALYSHEGGHESGHEGPMSMDTYKELKNSKNQEGGQLSGLMKQEIRLRFPKEIKEIEEALAGMFDGIIPHRIKIQIPEMIHAAGCHGDVVIKALEDLCQSDKIREGKGLTGSKASYLAKALTERFGLKGAG